MDNISTLDKAQSDMYNGYAFGSLGVVTSGSIWLISTIISYSYSSSQAIWTLLIGGVLINPVSKLLGIAIGLKGPAVNNPLKNLALEGTIWMIMCIPMAYGLSFQNTEWFFQAMLLIIGGRYLTFATVFGNKLFWILGATLGFSAYLLFRFKVQSSGSLLTGALIEIVFGVIMYFIYRKSQLKAEINEY
ncbi:DUF7010 family protein [Lacibacter sp.]|uniref:DUF7010 family protein n=1 Tax=Lacibacter sp. TaxID=1915409 RepID=UPI002B4B564C|nr:hypothetical protein [Lacibacter sp.]HLP38963.1 hypothetical protein [Lacibacter sp.]